MKKYAVLVREVWIQVYHIEAESPEKAIKQVVDGNVDPSEGLIEYSHTLPLDTWTVEEEGKINEQRKN